MMAAEAQAIGFEGLSIVARAIGLSAAPSAGVLKSSRDV